VNVSPAISQAVSAAVSAVVAKKAADEKVRLKLAEEQRESERRLELFKHSCDVLLQRLRPAVEQFNRECQVGQIRVKKGRETFGRVGSLIYVLPTNREISLEFYDVGRVRPAIHGGVVIGGGLLRIVGGRGANVVLLQEGSDDLYGRWTVCEMKFSGIIRNPGALLGKLGLDDTAVEPFGIPGSHFYEQISYARGIGHVLNYTFIPDVERYFAGLIAEGCG
jgi:hypothetical protein